MACVVSGKTHIVALWRGSVTARMALHVQDGRAVADAACECTEWHVEQTRNSDPLTIGENGAIVLHHRTRQLEQSYVSAPESHARCNCHDAATGNPESGACHMPGMDRKACTCAFGAACRMQVEQEGTSALTPLMPVPPFPPFAFAFWVVFAAAYMCRVNGFAVADKRGAIQASGSEGAMFVDWRVTASNMQLSVFKHAHRKCTV